MAFSADGRRLATGSRDATVRVWDLRAPDPSASPVVLSGHTKNVGALAFSKDSRKLVTGSDDATVHIWDLESGAAPSTAKGIDTGDNVFVASLSADARWLLARGPQGGVLLDLRADDPSQSRRALPDSDRGAYLSRDGRWLVTYGNDARRPLQEQLNNARGGDSRARVPIQKALESLTDIAAVLDLSVNDVFASRRILAQAGEPEGFSPDARWLVTDGRNDVPLLWSLLVQPPVSTVLNPHKKSLSSIDFSTDTHWLLTGSYDGTARLWDLTAKDVAASSRLLSGHESSVNGTLSGDGHWILTSSRGGAFLWENAGDGGLWQPIVLPVAIGDDAGAFTPDGRWLITTNYDSKKVSIWDLSIERLIRRACRTAGRNLTAAEWAQYFPGQPRVTTCPEYP
jgi:WD40 repeat protein